MINNDHVPDCLWCFSLWNRKKSENEARHVSFANDFFFWCLPILKMGWCQCSCFVILKLFHLTYWNPHELWILKQSTALFDSDGWAPILVLRGQTSAPPRIVQSHEAGTLSLITEAFLTEFPQISVGDTGSVPKLGMWGSFPPGVSTHPGFHQAFPPRVSTFF